jgi:hypothetical protein
LLWKREPSSRRQRHEWRTLGVGWSFDDGVDNPLSFEHNQAPAERPEIFLLTIDTPDVCEQGKMERFQDQAIS